MPELIAEATRWRVVLPVGVLKGITEADAYRLAAEHNVRPDRAVVRLYADGTEELGPWSPAPVLRLRTQAERDADGTTWRTTVAPECSTSHPQMHADCDGCTCLCHRPATEPAPEPLMDREPTGFITLEDARRWWHRYTRRNP